MKNILNLCSLFFLTFAGAQTDIALFNRHINAQGAQIIQDFVDLLEIPNVAIDLENIYKNAQYIMLSLIHI